MVHKALTARNLKALLEPVGNADKKKAWPFSHARTTTRRMEEPFMPRVAKHQALNSMPTYRQANGGPLLQCRSSIETS